MFVYVCVCDVGVYLLLIMRIYELKWLLNGSGGCDVGMKCGVCVVEVFYVDVILRLYDVGDDLDC